MEDDQREANEPPEFPYDYSQLPKPWAAWDYVLRDVAEGRHPSDEQIQRLLASDSPIPAAGQAYLAERWGTTPPGRPRKPYDDVRLYGRFPADMATAYMEFVHLYEELEEIEIADDTPRRNGPRLEEMESGCLFATTDPEDMTPATITVELRRIASRGVWRAKDPKGQARAIVGNRHGVSPSALEKFERKVNNDGSWLGEIF